MKKTLSILLTFVMLIACFTVCVSAKTPDYVIDLNFNTISSIADQTMTNGTKASLKIDTGWLPTNAELIQDDGVKVLHFQRTDNALHGFDLNTLGTQTGDPVVFSMTFKYTMSDGAFFHVAMVNGSSWFHSFRLLADGTMIVDTNGKTISAAGTTLSNKLTPNVYHTISIVYGLNTMKQYYYVDGTQVAEIKYYRKGAITAVISDITKFKIEMPAATGNGEFWIKNATVYNATKPFEATGETSFVQEAILDFNKVSSIANQNLANGGKATVNINTGWLPTGAALVQDDGVKVLHYQRTDNLLYGMDLNSLNTITGDHTIFSIDVKPILANDAYLQIAMVDQSYASEKWYYGLAVYSDGKVYANFKSNETAKSTRDTNGNLIGTITLGEYHTFSIAYDLINQTQAYYIDGNLAAEFTGYNGVATNALPNDITRFKIETPAATGNAELYIKKISVYNANQPKEAKIALSGMQVASELNTGNTTYDVRFLARIDAIDYDEVGFEIVANYGDSQTKNLAKVCTYAYTSVTAGSATIKASDLGGNYIIALHLKNVPVSAGEVTYTIRAYTIKDSVKVYTATSTLLGSFEN